MYSEITCLIFLVSLFYRWGNRSPENLSVLPQVTQTDGNRANVGTLAVQLLALSRMRT